MIDPLPRTTGHSFEVRLRIRRVDHCLEFGGILAEIVPQRGQRSGLGCSPCLRKLPRQTRGGAKMLFEIVRRIIVPPPVGDGSYRCLGSGAGRPF
jgi:hypothetical protein